MSISRVQLASGTSATSTSIIATWASATTNGNCLIAVLSGFFVGTITTPSGWTLAVSQVSGTGTFKSNIYYIANASSRSGSETFHASISSSAYLAIIEYSGVSTTSPLDVTASSTGTTNPADSGTTASTSNSDLCVATFIVDSSTAFSSPTNSFSIIDQSSSVGGGRAGGVLEYIQSATGTAETQITGGAGATYCGAIATFLPSASSHDSPTHTPSPYVWDASPDANDVWWRHTSYSALFPGGSTNVPQTHRPLQVWELSPQTDDVWWRRRTPNFVALAGGGNGDCSNVISRVQKVNNSFGTTNTATATWPSSTTSGNLVVAIINWQGASASSNTITPPSGWVSAVLGGNTNVATQIFYIANVGVRSGTETFTFATNCNWWIELVEYSGIITSSPLDQTANNADTGGSASVDSGTTSATTHANELWIAGLNDWSPGTFTSPTNGFVIVDQSGYSGGNQAGWTEKIVTAMGTANSGVTGTNSHWSGAIATFIGVCGASSSPIASSASRVQQTWDASPYMNDTWWRQVSRLIPQSGSNSGSSQLALVGPTQSNAWECDYYDPTLANAGIVTTQTRVHDEAILINVGSGAKFLAIGFKDNSGVVTQVASGKTIYGRFYYKPATLPGSTTSIFSIGKDVSATWTPSFEIKISSGGVLSAYANGSFLATGSTALSTGTWYRINFSCVAQSGGAYTLKINGATELSGTTGSLNATEAALFGTFVSATIAGYYCDAVFNTGSEPGSGSCHNLLPTGDVSTGSWVSSSGGTLWHVVGAYPWPGSPWISTTTNSDTFLLSTAGSVPAGAQINGVKIIGWYQGPQGDGTTTLAIKAVSSSVTRTGQTETVKFLGRGIWFPVGNDPNGNVAWTTTSLNSLEIGAEMLSGATNTSKISFLYLVVDYDYDPPPTPPSTHQMDQRWWLLPDYNGMYWEQFRLQPVPQTFLPTPFPKQHDQRVDPLPDYWQEWSGYTEPPIAALLYVPPTPPSTHQMDQRSWLLPDYNGMHWEQFRFQPVPQTFLPTPFPQQHDQRVDPLPDYWQEWSGYNEPPIAALLYVPPVLDNPSTKQPSQRFDPLPVFDDMWWHQRYVWPVPKGSDIFVNQQALQASKRFDPIYDWWKESHAYIQGPHKMFPRTLVRTIPGLPLFLQAIGFNKTGVVPLVIVGSTYPGVAKHIPLVTFSDAHGNVKKSGMPLFLETVSQAKLPTNMNLVMTGSKYSLAKMLTLFLKNTQTGTSNGLPLLISGPDGVDGAIPYAGGMNLFLKRRPANALPLYIAGPGVPMSHGLPLVIAPSQGKAGGITLAMPHTYADEAKGNKLFIRGF